MKWNYFLMGAGAMLTACQPTASGPAEPIPTPIGENTCGAEKLSDWTGKAVTPSARAAIDAASGAKNIRWLTPGMAVTMDYQPARLNVNIDKAGRYTAFHCS